MSDFRRKSLGAISSTVQDTSCQLISAEYCVQALRSCWGAVEQVRSYYVDWRMLRDLKRRQMAFDYADERLRINALRKNTILPKELQVKCSIILLFYIFLL